MAQGTPVQGGGLGVGDIASFKKMNIFLNGYSRYFKKARLYKGVDRGGGSDDCRDIPGDDWRDNGDGEDGSWLNGRS